MKIAYITAGPIGYVTKCDRFDDAIAWHIYIFLCLGVENNA